MLGTDVAVVSSLSVLTGIAAPENWTSNMLRNGLFLIPLIAAAQLDPYVSGVIAVPTLGAFLAVAWISQSANEEPWASILLTATVLAGLAAGSVALSRIQRAKVEAIEDLAQQRTRLLEEMLGLEKRERQSLSERLHDGALQYVIVARQDLDDVRDGSAEATDRVDTSLKECSQLLRDVVRELHPEVLSRSGLKAALTALADSIGSRAGLAVHLDADAWPEALRTDADHVLYSAAREISTNAIKHARAQNLMSSWRARPGRQACESPTTASASPRRRWPRASRTVTSGWRRSAPKSLPPAVVSMSAPFHRVPKWRYRYPCHHRSVSTRRVVVPVGVIARGIRVIDAVRRPGPRERIQCLRRRAGGLGAVHLRRQSQAQSAFRAEPQSRRQPTRPACATQDRRAGRGRTV